MLAAGLNLGSPLLKAGFWSVVNQGKLVLACDRGIKRGMLFPGLRGAQHGVGIRWGIRLREPLSRGKPNFDEL